MRWWTGRETANRRPEPAATGIRKPGWKSCAEAEIVRWMFESFLNGMTPLAISNDLNRRGIPTAQGKRWSIPTVLRLLDRGSGGIRVFRGQEIGPGMWPAIIGEAMFREVQERRAFRSAVTRDAVEQRGSTCCAACCRALSAARGCRSARAGGRPVYVCTNFRPTDGQRRNATGGGRGQPGGIRQRRRD